jgi:hypothetical protein
MSSSYSKTEQFLKKVEAYLEHLTIDDKYKVLSSIKDDLQQAREKNNLSEKEVLQSFGPPLEAVNRYLVQHRLPKATKKKRWSLLKVIGLSLLTFIVAGTLAVLILIKSLTPIYEINEEDGTLSLLGGRYTFEQDMQSFFQTTRLKHLKNDLNYKIEGDFKDSSINQVEIIVEAGDLSIQPSEEGAISYKCMSNQANVDYFSTEGQSISLDLKGGSQCLFYFPKEIDLKIVQNSGHIRLANLAQNVELTLESGIVSWRQADPSLFTTDVRVVNGNVDDQWKMKTLDGPYQVQINITNGNVSLR